MSRLYQFFSIFTLSLFLIHCASGISNQTVSMTITNLVSGTTNVAVGEDFTINFSSAVNTETVNVNSLFLVERTDLSLSTSVSDFNSDLCNIDNKLNATISCTSNTSCILNPSIDLNADSTYVLCFTDEIEFLLGTFAGAQVQFTTASSSTEDTTAPTVAITSNESTLTASSPFTITITFSETVEGFSLSDLDITNGTASNLNETTAGQVFTASITPSNDPTTVTVGIAAAAVTDEAGNENTAASNFSIRYDTTALTVALSESVDDRTNITPVEVTVTFSEEVTGFSLDDLSLTNGTASNLNSSANPIFTFDLTPTADGVVTVALASGVATDSLSEGKSNTAASSLNFTYDSSAPTISSITPTNSATNISISATIAVVFNESMNTSTLTTNTADTDCDGSLQVSDDNFSTCVQMATAPVATNSDKTFTLTPDSDLDPNTTYKVRITTDVTDVAGNSLASTNTQANGFTTEGNPIIFVTATDVPVDMSDYPLAANGIEAADEYCNDVSDGNHPNNGATFKALIVDSINRLSCTSAGCITGGTSEQIDWPLAADTTYSREDGTEIGTTDSTKLFTFPLMNSMTDSTMYSWTGINLNYTANGGDCAEWTAASGSTVVADSASTTSSAIGGIGTSCTVSVGTRHLICVQQ